jgi:hypothetical protein
MINRLPTLIFLLANLLLVGSCTDSAPAGNGTSATQESTATADSKEVIDTVPSLAPPSCPVDGEVLDGNRSWIRSSDILAVIKADATTTTEDFGPSHRIFEILDGRTCASKFKTTLPENTSPDFPYYIAEIQYNSISNVVGIRGFYDLYICDLDRNYQLSPKYFATREYDDPQSGMIQRVEVWEDYLLGYAQDLGAFAFNLSDKSNPVPVLPFAEWVNNAEGGYNSLFLLPTERGMQAIMPYFDVEAGALLLYPLFDQPQQVSTNIQKSARNNQYLVLRKTDASQSPLAINLRTRQLVDLPADIATKKTQEIIAWMKAQ